MTSPDERTPLNYDTARGMGQERAAFFYRGPSQTVAEGVVFFPTQGNATAFLCENRIFMVDTTPQWYAGRTLDDLRKNHSDAPVEAVVYTHGHIDHVTGAETVIADAAGRGYQRPRIIGHRDIAQRFDRYRLMHEQNNFINRVQFALPESVRAFSTVPWTYPDTSYLDALETTVGGERFELYHSRGETDDETWVWCPGRRVLCTGDTFVWSTPNAGNPYKVQRYAKDWADALEQMAAKRPVHLLPGHGPPLSGEEAIEEALLTTAHFLRSIHDQVVTKMNEGKWLEDILREIDYPGTDKPWLRPIYDHPEFVARNVYRLYGGWYDGDPANILPAHSADIATQLVDAAGAGTILARARRLRDGGELQLACHLVDFVRKGEPDNVEAWRLWRELFEARAAAEPSLMARGAFYSAVREAEQRLRELSAG
ncbi:MAG: alkyl sulfatase dimerization domain-containing protein [Dehalococcoidia bacterium]|nr:alkyl sulfatase dimerization domain-containing protein [Dehalococcoidia bacterium]MDZ4278313.1 alkyl sulfatase dimerization domain-containing protein [Dehalococcoidia bacterium]